MKNSNLGKHYLGLVVCTSIFIVLCFYYNGLWNIALYSNAEVITSHILRDYILKFSPATGIAFALGSISTLEILWLVPEEKREKYYHLTLWIAITIFGNSFMAYLISQRPDRLVEIDAWIIIVETTVINIIWYFLLLWTVRMKKITKTNSEELMSAIVKEEDALQTRELIINVLKKLGCAAEIETRAESIWVYFTYQGEKFTIECNDSCLFIVIYDTWWYQMSIYSDVEDIANLHKVINFVNQHANVTLIHTVNQEIEEIGVHSKRNILFISQIPEIDQYLVSVLNEFFKVQRYVVTELEKCKVTENK